MNFYLRLEQQKIDEFKVRDYILSSTANRKIIKE